MTSLHVTGDALVRLVLSALAGLLAGVASRVAVLGAAGLRQRVSGPGRGAVLRRLSRTCHRAWTTLLVVTGLRVALPRTDLAAALRHSLEHVADIGLIAASAWLLVHLLWLVGDVAFARVRVDVADNRRARKVRTQIALARRIVVVAVALVAVAVALMTFRQARAAGASLLASAGVLGVIAGVAAQSVLGNVFAGLQIAFTDSLRLGDVVVVQDEWGRVEDITLTYVVLALWDERRLVLPTSYFTTTPFQNWTRKESRVLGEVLLHVDYTTPVEPLRQAAQRIVEGSPLWDRKDWVLQVVDTTPSTMVVRVLASAADAPSAYDLRCEVREKLIDHLQAHHPTALPRLRVSQPEDPRAWRSSSPPTDVSEPGSGRTVFSS